MAQQDEYGEDAYAAVGTPFEILETVEDVQKAKARKNKDHYVLDEQGRRRFHGAFTGGFSAGYYNTVGSKEGTYSCLESVTDHVSCWSILCMQDGLHLPFGHHAEPSLSFQDRNLKISWTQR